MAAHHTRPAPANCAPPAFEPAPPGAVNPELARRTGAVCGAPPLPDVVAAGLGAGGPRFLENRRVPAPARRLLSPAALGCPGAEALLFDNLPPHLVWANLSAALPADEFKVRASGRGTLALFRHKGGARKLWSGVRSAAVATADAVLALAREAVAGSLPAFERAAARAGGGALWDYAPYYRLLPCLAPLLADEPLAVFAGFLFPQRPRAELPPGEPPVPRFPGWSVAARWYAAAADARRDAGWRRDVVRRLALRSVTVRVPSGRVAVRRSAAEAALPGVRGETAAAVVRVLVRFVAEPLPADTLLVPDGTSVRARPCLDAAVCGTYRAPTRSLPQHVFSPRLRALIGV